MRDGPIIIALGANLPSEAGPPEVTLARALDLLEGADVQVRAVSRFYRTAPVPASDQPDYINAAARLDTRLDPHALLARLHAVEQALGRHRNIKWEARVIDLDLIACGSCVLPDSWPDAETGGVPGHGLECGLAVPHPRLHERAFVLVPMADIAPDWRHPVTQADVGEMLARLGDFAAPRPLDFPASRT